MMNVPLRIRLSRARGWRMPEGAVNVARPGKWGNPFVVGRDGTREQCVAKFYQLTRGFIDLSGNVDIDEQLAYYQRLRRSIGLLKGRSLACWCHLDGKPCHADILLNQASGVPLPPWAACAVDIGRVRLGIDARVLLQVRRKRRREKAAEAVE